MLLCSVGWADEDASFLDDFAAFDASRWSTGDHVLGRSYLDPANVSTDGEHLRISLPAHTLEGGEIGTSALHGYGTYAARMRVPHAPGSITGFFLYRSPDYSSEIDIEIFNDRSRRIMFSTYAGGAQTHTETVNLPFDPTTGYHEYGLDYAPDAVTFYVDGQRMERWETDIPQRSMHLMVNAWYPTWLASRKPDRTVSVLVDYIEYSETPATARS